MVDWATEKVWRRNNLVEWKKIIDGYWGFESALVRDQMVPIPANDSSTANLASPESDFSNQCVGAAPADFDLYIQDSSNWNKSSCNSTGPNSRRVKPK